MQTNQHKNFFSPALPRNEIDYKSVYVSCFPMIRSMVFKNSGSVDDARDIFQEAIIVLFQNSSREKFELNVGTCTYLYSIARNKWLKHIRDHGKRTGLDETNEPADENSFVDDDEQKQRQRLLVKHLSTMGEKCQRIIKLYFEGIPGEEIAKELEFSSYEYYRVAKNRCIENLKKLIHADPLFKELI